MSIVVERARNPWLPVAAVLALIPLATISVWGVKELRAASSPARVEAQEPVTIAAPDWAQREWVMTTQRWPGKARPVAADVAATRSLVASLYDTMLLEPAGWPSAVTDSFAPEARAQLLATRTGWPEGVTDVRIKSRRLRIGIQSGRADRAIATVRISATATAEGRELALWHRAQLWMEKRDGTWRVFAFDMRQAPLG